MVFGRRARQRSSQEAQPDAVDLDAIPAAYRTTIEDAERVRAQFHNLVSGLDGGPLRDRLVEIGRGVDNGVTAIWRSVRHAAHIETVIVTLDPVRVREDLKRARRAAGGAADDATVAAFSARFASTQRLLNSLDELRDRIPTLEARLGTAVATAAEIVLTSSIAPSTARLDDVGRAVDELVVELDSLHAATDELG